LICLDQASGSLSLAFVIGKFRGSRLKPKLHYADFAIKFATKVADTSHESLRHKSRRRRSWFVSADQTGIYWQSYLHESTDFVEKKTVHVDVRDMFTECSLTGFSCISEHGLGLESNDYHRRNSHRRLQGRATFSV